MVKNTLAKKRIGEVSREKVQDFNQDWYKVFAVIARSAAAKQSISSLEAGLLRVFDPPMAKHPLKVLPKLYIFLLCNLRLLVYNMAETENIVDLL